MNDIRIEIDSMGAIEVPAVKLWGAQTQRSLQFFQISSEKIPQEVIYALAQIKLVTAMVNSQLGLLKKQYANAIIQAADEVLAGKHDNEFPLVIWQTGSGTQSNMNMNEVLANRASELLGGKRGKARLIHPIDDVNKSQSSNDVFATAMHIAAVVTIYESLIPQIKNLKNSLSKKSNNFSKIIKVGRTHLQDAIPLTLGQEISGWVTMLEHSLIHIEDSIPHLCELALGGTAVGTGLNTHPEYAVRTATIIADLTGHPFVTAPNKFESLATCDALVYAHGALKSLAVSLMKIANDVRWLSSGPRCGIGEIIIPENEPGSSIMPGKVNPTQCEAITMLCCQVMGNDAAINIGGASGQLELNVYRPMVIYNFMQSVRLLTDGINSFNKNCVIGIEPNYDRIQQLLNQSLMLVTALNIHIGYDKAAEIAQKAYRESISLKQAAIKLGYLSEKQFDEWVQPENMISAQ
ncbi:class II fumarate hydratase [Candidatus Palibaumannia cicadellinicola]|uniref:Fumarate hydratase class II n=1 Tax=Baumannia cicadellinicola subsp. Homalodisca coagulata TaxID=374463 RepID=Q1LT52_BAUCH|nr:class II fumarate hydratase [Candidatus Baumannia cicadellinicola]ABF14176.1 fumarate hydratase, class II [Baumannia cicadellinicola str. Hc (Homalodisca coagulata)]MBS0032812.1 class II fumarate hydratase [Candidatus Baumannia cicadellinicola]MBS0032843.1 class II fumarate hydratase [Candidatus Baumannia cicadellinicola]MCJ7462098.1 class II fumarate hydratase [Candidatus Baumannia cicadellinicola]MCJ7462892.1 class II fumarate hydratase [Candidatus Baumannia cicadellinicola]